MAKKEGEKSNDVAELLGNDVINREIGCLTVHSQCLPFKIEFNSLLSCVGLSFNAF